MIESEHGILQKKRRSIEIPLLTLNQNLLLRKTAAFEKQIKNIEAKARRL
jgi:hypothetical protein